MAGVRVGRHFTALGSRALPPSGRLGKFEGRQSHRMVTGSNSNPTSAVVRLPVFGFIFGRRHLATVRGQWIRIGGPIAYPALVVGLFVLTLSVGAPALLP